MFTNENTKMVTSHLFWNVENGESLCKDESKTRTQSHAKDMCTNEATTVLLTMGRKQYKLESEVGNKEVMVQSYSVLCWQRKMPAGSWDFVKGKK